jgi:hypothetical protein
VDLGLVPVLARLFADPYAVPSGESDLARLAREQSQNFATYFHHAAPFRRASLASLFERCRATEQAEQCARILADAEAELGPLGAAQETAFAPRGAGAAPPAPR